MEQLVKDLKDSGFDLVYYEPLDAWVVSDVFASFLPSQFAEIVFKRGFVFSCGVTLDGRCLYVKFRKL